MTVTLVVLPRFPSERTGTGQRSRLIVAGAVAAGPTHVVLLDGKVDPQNPQTLPGVASVTNLSSQRITPRGFLARRLGGGLRLISPRFTYAPDPALRAALLDMIARHGIDAVIFRYARLFAAAGITAADRLRVLVDVDDRDDQKYQTRLERLLGTRLARTRPARGQLNRLAQVLRTGLSRATHVWFVAREDAWTLLPATTAILPNVPYWDVLDHPPPADRTAAVVLFIGIHDHLPNRDAMRWFLSHVWPRLRRMVPEARLRIVGRGAWETMAPEFPGLAGVEFVGEVDDLADEYSKARVTICPVREGGGSKIKLIEAAAFARPIVAVSHAVRGFQGEGLAQVVQADAPDMFADACAVFLNDPAAAALTGAALRNWQQATYSRGAFVSAVTETLLPSTKESPQNRDNSA
jgi:glycosyltransferase involved in cell wall biosynthesis